MPELPEVETVMLSLKEKVLNKTFDFIWAENKRKKSSLEKLKGKKIKDVQRKGKGIFVFLSGEEVLFIHLKMTGHLLLGKWEEKNGSWESEGEIMQDPKNGFLRVIFFFRDGSQLALSDPRKFATISLISEKEKEERIGKLGPDPLFIGENEFVNLFKGKKGRIKPLLMEQKFIAGIGNIYASEILFKAKINPYRKVSAIEKKELTKVFKEMRKILEKAIKLKGDSTSDYRLLDGKKGGYQREHLVYDRERLNCFVCKNKIKRVNLGGRGTYYCPECQK